MALKMRHYMLSIIKLSEAMLSGVILSVAVPLKVFFVIGKLLVPSNV